MTSLVLFLSQFKNGKTGRALPTHFVLYYFRKGKNASQAQKKLCAVYGDEALKERQCRNWFERFRSGDFSLKNAQRSGRPVEVDETHIKAIIDSDRHSTTRDIAEKLNVSHTCIEKKLKTLTVMSRNLIYGSLTS
ncbi:hypothetical protein K0M31_002485 [Melipona bicolor]|uniref:Mos1 transposase HTH domain-containing protein n=1 Tax=Melipona bicolor TaxID=60889 RepID=A0AA40GI91_9HYME|nr:hypothetical protein K0M31_002485 [Melipona bicolor]